MQDSTTIGVRMPRWMYEALLELKEKNEDDLSLSAIVRGILREHLKPKKTNGRRK